jgi:cobalt/nickel transport system permease protein
MLTPISIFLILCNTISYISIISRHFLLKYKNFVVSNYCFITKNTYIITILLDEVTLIIIFVLLYIKEVDIMHIGDGLIPWSQAVVYWLIALAFIIKSLNWAGKEMDEMKIPMLAALAAGIFAIQAMNIPIPWGTSGHMVGAALAAIILGSPYAAVLLLTLVLVVQGFLFGDGGVTAMGANIVNMGVVGGFVGFYSYNALKNSIGMVSASFAAGWLSIFIAALVCAVEMYFADMFPLVAGLMFMGLYHAVIGVVGEGLITAIAFRSIMLARPDIVSEKSLVRVAA